MLMWPALCCAMHTSTSYASACAPAPPQLPKQYSSLPACMLMSGCVYLLLCILAAVVCLQVSCALWVLAEYSSTLGEVEAATAAIHAGLGPLPLLQLSSGEGGEGGGQAGRVADAWQSNPGDDVGEVQPNHRAVHRSRASPPRVQLTG
jgi:hypothetical protein